jgi:prepilin-type N-terminal cleavage/methylation domain-containing protein
MRPHPKRDRGFTLVELLVVIAIIGVLVALLLPAVQAAREAARRGQCVNNLKQLATAVHNAADSRRVFPPGFVSKTSISNGNIWIEAQFGESGHSWMLETLPFMEQGPLYERWNFSLNVAQNAEAAQTDVPSFYCPSRRAGVRDEDRRSMFMEWQSGGTDYGGCMGAGNYFFDDGNSTGPFYHRYFFDVNALDRKETDLGIFYWNSKTKFSHITDGTSNTLMLGELQRIYYDSIPTSPFTNGASSSLDGWAAGGVATLFDTDNDAASNPGGVNNWMFESPGSEHAGGANFAMGDVSVRFISENVDGELFEQLGTMAGGEVAPLE